MAADKSTVEREKGGVAFCSFCSFCGNRPRQEVVEKSDAEILIVCSIHAAACLDVSADDGTTGRME
jgi:hypothetical protein